MSKTLLHFYVFGVGAAILALEVSASRLLAPFFGTSLAVWGNILGIVLGALALGYYYGGILADRAPHQATLGMLTWTGGLLTAAIPLAAQPLLGSVSDALSGLPLFLIAASFISMLALFAFPIFLLGAVTPLANRIGIVSVSDIGSVSGSLSASATAGSLVGAFLPSFITIPFLGTRLTILGSGIVLLLLGAAALQKKEYYLGLLLPLFSLVMFRTVRPPELVFQKDSAYQHIRVVEKEGHRYLLTDAGNAVQTISMNADGLTGGYFDAIAATPFLLERGRPPRILVIGIAGGTLIRQFRHFLGDGVRIDAVDIDPEMPAVARRYFDLRPEDATIAVADGRAFLRQSSDTYDLIVVDAFRSELYAPFHLATVEFFRLVAERLAPGGLLALNTPGEKDGMLPLYIGETLRQAFPVATDIPHPTSYNHLLIGSFGEIDWSRLASAPEQLSSIAAYLRENASRVTSADHVLTDDRAPLEFLTDRFFKNLVKVRRSPS